MLLCVSCLGMMLAAIGNASASPATPEEHMADESRRIISRSKAIFREPPHKIPSEVSVDAPLLGNGDMAVCIGGAPETQTYYLSKNDFWRLKSQYGESTPKPLGMLRVSIPALAGASYRMEQDLYTAVTRATFQKEAVTLRQSSWVAATENLLVVTLDIEGGSTPVDITFEPAAGSACQASHGTDGPLHWFERRYVEGVDIPTAAIAVLALPGTSTLSCSLTPGKTITLAVAIRSAFQGSDYHDKAMALAYRAHTEPSYVEDLLAAHRGWWARFWAQSYVELGDEDLERHYYLSNYIMGSCSRDPAFPPPIFGTWITTDSPGWLGDYHLNYNHMAPYYGLYSSNHIEQADPYHAPVLAFMERGRWYAHEILGIRGVYYPVGIGPKGIETTRNNASAGPAEKGGLFYGQKSNAAYGVVNLSARWRHTYDPEYARTVYPFVREVAAFWEDYLALEDGRYVIRKDAIHEGSGENVNAILSLGLVRNLFETALEMSTELNADEDRHAKWRDILDRLSAFPTQIREGKTVFRYTEQGTDWWENNTLGIQHVYPAGAIGLDSDPKLLEMARNTLTVMNRWHDFNGMNSFFPAAVRVGYDAETVFQKLRGYVRDDANINGFAKDNPHGIENCSIVPNTVNEMLCMGNQGVLRFFPVWPKERPARFANLRVEGAFLCTGALEGGVVRHACIVSERGRDCTAVNPWPGKTVTLYRDGKKSEHMAGPRFTFPTTPGETIEWVPADQ